MCVVSKMLLYVWKLQSIALLNSTFFPLLYLCYFIQTWLSGQELVLNIIWPVLTRIILTGCNFCKIQRWFHQVRDVFLVTSPIMADWIMSFVVDGGVEGDLPLSLHHMAWLWCPRISRLLPQLPLQSAGVRLVGPGARPLSCALQRWDWTLRDVRLGGHLPGPGENREGSVSKRNPC